MMTIARKFYVLFLVPALILCVSVCAAPRSAATTYNDTLYKNTNGFDTCASKSQTMLSDWWDSTPWYDIGVYLGGSAGESLGCYDGAAAVDRALNTGYGVVLYWFGPQLGSGCNMRSYSSYISLNTTTAYDQGVSQGKLAASAASSASLPYGTVIYYDMESYYANSGCRAAAKAFINGWDYEVFDNTSYDSGAYGSSCASYVSDWASISHVPVQISPADTALDNGSVYGYPCLSNTYWDQNQRVGQFSTDHATYNGYTLYVDENCVDGYVPTIYSSEISSGCSDVL